MNSKDADLCHVSGCDDLCFWVASKPQRGSSLVYTLPVFLVVGSIPISQITTNLWIFPVVGIQHFKIIFS